MADDDAPTTEHPTSNPPTGGAAEPDTGAGTPDGTGPDDAPRKPRRRGSRGGRSRTKRPAGDPSAADAESDASAEVDDATSVSGSGGQVVTGRSARPRGSSRPKNPDELPDRPIEGRPPVEAADRALVRKPRIGDSRPAPAAPAPAAASGGSAKTAPEGGGKAGGRAKGGGRGTSGSSTRKPKGGGGQNRRRESSGGAEPVEAAPRKARERKGKPVGRYLMCVSAGPMATQIAVLEGRNLIEHYVSRPADDISQIHGNIYLGKVQNVLPGMEAAFVDIGTPKNAVLYRGDVQYDAEDIEEGGTPRIEQLLKPKQAIVCQVTKNPIAHKGARLTQEVSLPGRFVVLIPNSTTYGISKRLPDDERKRLRQILDRVRPAGHGLIVRTAAEGVGADDIERDMLSLTHQWEQIEQLAAKATAPALLYREPDMAVRVIREEFNTDYRGIVLDDPALHAEVRSYVAAISPEVADRVELYDTTTEPLPLFERYHVHEQLHKALDRKVWLPSGGSLIIEHTEALTVIDVNTGKNVGTSSLEETVFRNNLEAAEEIAKQLRLRDIGGIIVIDFIDMEIEANKREVIKVFRDALARDKTRTQVFDISDLGLVEMTRKRIGEGLLESFATACPECEGRGLVLDQVLLG